MTNTLAIKPNVTSLKYWLFLISGRLVTVHYSKDITNRSQAESAAINKARRYSE